MPEDTEWVEARHPDVHVSDDIESATFSRAAFDAVWKDKGWEIVTDEAPAPLPAPARAGRTAATTTTTTQEV